MIKLRDIREMQGISQKELGVALGVAQNTISNWENGSREPNSEMLEKIAAYFQIPIPLLLGQGIYGKKDFVIEHMGVILAQIREDWTAAENHTTADGDSKLLNNVVPMSIVDLIETVEPEIQFKMLTAFLYDININEDDKRIQLVYYV